MSWPTLSVQIDLISLPSTANASNTWTDITAYVIDIQTRRGRSDALARVEAGTATLTLDNADRRFDPTYTSGAYYPNVAPMKKIRVRATYSAVTYYLFTGYVTSWPPDWPGGLDATVRIECVDAFGYFAQAKLNGAYGNEFTNWSINTWLTFCDWAVADRALYSGQSQIQAGTFINTPALQHFQNCVDVEDGLFFMDGQGLATFHNRSYRLTNSLTSVATYGDQSPELPWKETTKVYDDANIWNEARITRTGGTEQVALDITSVNYYFRRTYTKTLPMLTDNEALSLAQYLVGRYANPIFRYTTFTLDGNMDDALWPHILGRAVSERVTIKERPPGAPAETITQECYIEGMAFDIAQDKWLATFQVSAADSQVFWILQSATYGILNSTTRLGY